MPRKVLTVRELESVGQGGELVVAFGTIVTPLARDEAEARGITIRFEEPKPAEPKPQHLLRRARLRSARITAASTSKKN